MSASRGSISLSSGCRAQPSPSPNSCAQLPHLVDDVDAIIQLLPLQEGVEVLQEVEQMLLSVAVWDKDGHVLQG